MSKILIADDSKLIVTLISSLLKSIDENNILYTAFDGNEAVNIATAEKPDLILMDWQMPNLSGLDALKNLKMNPETKTIPVVMLTASENVSEALQCGAMDFIQKPFQKDEFLLRIKNILAAIQASKYDSNEFDREALKQSWMEIEAERDKLKHLKETLIRQKKELTNVIGITKSMHQKYFIENHLIKTSFANSFAISIPLFDIPSHMIWSTQTNNNLWIITTCYNRKGILSFLIAVSLDKMFTHVFNHDCKPNNSLIQNIYDKAKNEFPDIEINFNICFIDSENNTLYVAGNCIPLFLIDRKSQLFSLQNSDNTDSFAIFSFEKGNCLYFIQNGFIENNIEEKAHSHLFTDFLKTITAISFDKHHAALIDMIKNWQHDLRQQNDILVLGLQF